MHSILQIAYFKAKQFFFNFTIKIVNKDDLNFILDRYFPSMKIKRFEISDYEYFEQRRLIAKKFGYRRWSKTFKPRLANYLLTLVRRDVTLDYLVMESLTFLQQEKIIRPGYTTLQIILSEALTTERKRLADILKDGLSEAEKTSLLTLLDKEDTLSKLAALKQDAKGFKHHMLVVEREKLTLLKPLYVIAKAMVPKLKLSQQNLHYYASLAHYYSIYELRKMLLPHQTHLYLLCYVWQRYQQLNDNFIEAFCYLLNKLNQEAKAAAKEAFSKYAREQQREYLVMRKLARFYVDEKISDQVAFGHVRKKAFKIIPEDELRDQVSPTHKLLKEIDFKWAAIDSQAQRLKNNLRPLVMALDFDSDRLDLPWLQAIHWLKALFSQQKSLQQCEVNQCPEKTIPKRLEHYLLIKDEQRNAKLQADRYEFWLYRQLRKRIQSGEIYLNDSILHRSFHHELVPLDQCEKVLKELDISASRSPIKQRLDYLFDELHTLLMSFNRDLKAGKLLHLRYDEKDGTLHLRKIKGDDEAEEMVNEFYKQLPLCDITEVLRFVNDERHFLSALTPLQPRYAKHGDLDNCLLAILIGQAMNHDDVSMAEIAGIPRKRLQEVYATHFRLATLKAASNLISNGTKKLPIYSDYSIDIDWIYSAVDGQKYTVKFETAKARNSKKYFGNAKGVVAYTLLSNHIPLQLELIGAHEHESYYTFDIWYNNTTDIVPDVVTGDMHCINKANFGIMDWFGAKLFPRFTNLESQRRHLFCGNDLLEYQGCLIKPAGQLDRQLIEEEWPNLSRIIATLGLKEMTQSTLVKKLCNYTTLNRTQKALFEYDKLIRSIHTLKYFSDPKLQKNVHRSQNQLEAYHQLRAAIARAHGSKQLSGRNDIEIAISNECGRLLANAVIYYNSIILSKLKEHYEATGNSKGLEMLKHFSPVAWRHIHFLGHYLFSDDRKIDIDQIIKAFLAKQKD
ncbi:MAG: Tn3 family transposase [Legionellales bacterium]|nr:Tn3 family transposase [Legionellales bacterium]